MATYTDKFVIPRVLKTGSSLLHDITLGQFGANDFGAPQHAPLSYLRSKYPDLVEGKESVAIARNPWDWYGSYYLHVTQAAGEEPSEAGFRKALKMWTHSAVHEPVTIDNPAAVSVHWKSSRKGTWGLCSAVHQHIAGDADIFITTRRLREGVEEIFGEPLQAQFGKPRNDRHSRDPAPQIALSSYGELYDDEMIDWVRAADALFIERFGFEPFEPAASAVHRTSV